MQATSSHNISSTSRDESWTDDIIFELSIFSVLKAIKTRGKTRLRDYRVNFLT